MSLTTLAVAAALALGSVAGSGGVGVLDAGVHAAPSGKHHPGDCARKGAGHQGWCLHHRSGTYLPPVVDGYTSAPAGEAVVPVVGGYASAPPGQAVAPVVGGYASAPAGQPLIPVGGG